MTSNCPPRTLVLCVLGTEPCSQTDKDVTYSLEAPRPVSSRQKQQVIGLVLSECKLSVSLALWLTYSPIVQPALTPKQFKIERVL